MQRTLRPNHYFLSSLHWSINADEEFVCVAIHARRYLIIGSPCFFTLNATAMPRQDSTALRPLFIVCICISLILEIIKPWTVLRPVCSLQNPGCGSLSAYLQVFGQLCTILIVLAASCQNAAGRGATDSTCTLHMISSLANLAKFESLPHTLSFCQLVQNRLRFTFRLLRASFWPVKVCAHFRLFPSYPDLPSTIYLRFPAS